MRTPMLDVVDSQISNKAEVGGGMGVVEGLKGYRDVLMGWVLFCQSLDLKSFLQSL